MSYRKYKELIKLNKLILKSQRRFRSKTHKVFTEKVHKITLSINDDRRIQSSDSKETYAYGMSKDLVCKKKEIKFNNIKNDTKRFDFDHITREDIRRHNPN